MRLPMINDKGNRAHHHGVVPSSNSKADHAKHGAQRQFVVVPPGTGNFMPSLQGG